MRYMLLAVGIAAMALLIAGCAKSKDSDSHTGVDTGALQVTTPSLPVAVEGMQFSFTLQVANGTPPYTWNASGLPSGLSIEPDTGQISGTPDAGTSASGPYTVTVTVTDASSLPQTTTSQFVLTIKLLHIATTLPPCAREGASYTAYLTVTGGSGSYTWTVSGLPSGLTYDSATGTISGTPDTGTAATSPYTLTVTAQDDSSGTMDGAIITLEVHLPPEYGWTRRMGGTENDFPHALCTDPSGNLYVAGVFGWDANPSYTVNFAEDWGGADTKTCSGTWEDSFITKVGADGEYCWTRTIAGSHNESIRSLCTDAHGNIYAAGFFGWSTLSSYNLDFAKDWGGSDIKSIAGYGDAFITKIDANNNYCWTRRIGGWDDEVAFAVCTDTERNVYMAGLFGWQPGSYSVDFAQDWGGSDPKASAGKDDAFITKIAPSGNYLWTRRIGGEDRELVSALCTDSNGNLYVTGYFGDYYADSGYAVNFAQDWGGNDMKTIQGKFDAFITKIDSAGNYCWTHTICGAEDVIPERICTDATGNVYLAGYFDSYNIPNYAINFAEDWGKEDTKINIGDEDVFITKINVNGSYCWTYTMGGTAYDWGLSACTDPSGNVYLTGLFSSSTLDFAADWGGSDRIRSTGTHDVFITKIDAAGCYCWTYRMGGPEQQRGYDICTDLNGNLYVTGIFYGSTVNFAEDWGGTDEKTGAGSNDIFITKINQP